MRRRYTTGSFLVFLPSFVNSISPARAHSVTWISPTAGDVYNEGDTIVGQWAANNSFPSPSFSLCTSGIDGGGSSVACGSAVWPLIEEDGGTNMVHLSLPAGPAAASFFLQMSDATSGESVSSPSFSIQPASVVPMSSAHFPVEVPATASAPAAPHQTSVSSSIQPLPEYNSLSRPAPTAAYAVPLSLVGTVLLVAGALGVYHRRKLRDEQARKSGRPSHPRAASSYTRFPERHARITAASSTGSRPSTPTASVAGSYHDSKYYEEGPTEDDRRSLYSVASLKRQPMIRRATREPFQRDVHLPRVVYDRKRPTKVSAGMFRAGVSPVPPKLSRFSSVRSDASTIRREKAQARLAQDSQDMAGGLGAVVDRYFHPSPIPPSPRLPPPDKLHIRQGTKDYLGLSNEKPLPRCPTQPYEGPATRRRVSGRDLVQRRVSGNR